MNLRDVWKIQEARDTQKPWVSRRSWASKRTVYVIDGPAQGSTVDISALEYAQMKDAYFPQSYIINGTAYVLREKSGYGEILTLQFK